MTAPKTPPHAPSSRLPQIGYIVKKIGVPIRRVIEYPNILSYSLVSLLGPRLAFIKKHNPEILGLYSMRMWVGQPDPLFAAECTGLGLAGIDEYEIFKMRWMATFGVTYSTRQTDPKGPTSSWPRDQSVDEPQGAFSDWPSADTAAAMRAAEARAAASQEEESEAWEDVTKGVRRSVSPSPTPSSPSPAPGRALSPAAPLPAARGGDQERVSEWASEDRMNAREKPAAAPGGLPVPVPTSVATPAAAPAPQPPPPPPQSDRDRRPPSTPSWRPSSPAGPGGVAAPTVRKEQAQGTRPAITHRANRANIANRPTGPTLDW